MIKAYNPEEVKAAEQQAIVKGDHAISMIQRAADALLDYIFEKGLDCRRVFILAGRGNNGADGLLLGKLLKDRGVHTDVYRIPSAKYTQENVHFSKATSLLHQFPSDLSGYTLIVDALYGIGFKGAPCDEERAMIDAINDAAASVLSVDLPSGVNGSNGSFDLAVKADYTCAMNCLKPGHLIFPGAENCGEITVLDCKIPLPQPPSAYSLTLSDLHNLPQRTVRSNKSTYGKIAVVAGSKGMAGASYFAAKAALFSGAGLVEIYCPEENRVILQTLLPEAVLRVYDEHSMPHQILDSVRHCNAMILGPGLGISSFSKALVKTLLEELTLPAVVDADGLNLCVGSDLLKDYKGPLVITPHPGEASRLLSCTVKEVTDEVLLSARTLSAQCGATVLLKDAHTLICTDDLVHINLSGNDGMATAGSGDLLAGIIATLLSQKLSAHDAASVGAYVHGLAGDLAAKKHGKRSTTASRIAEQLEELFKMADQGNLINSIEEM